MEQSEAAGYQRRAQEYADAYRQTDGCDPGDDCRPAIDMEKETGTKASDIKVIATGGLNSMLQPITDVFDFVDKELTINGMLRISRLIKQ